MVMIIEVLRLEIEEKNTHNIVVGTLKKIVLLSHILFEVKDILIQ